MLLPCTSFGTRSAASRWLPLLGALTAFFFLLIASSAFAQSGAWPAFLPEGDHNISRGSGGYFSWWKLLLSWLLFLLWVRVTDWVSRDCLENDFPFAVWVPVVFFPFLFSLFAFIFTIPIFWVGYGLGFLAFLIPTMVYVVQRNKIVEPHLRVMTPDHIRYLLSQRGVMSAEKKAAHEKGAPVTFAPMSGKDDQANQASLIRARQHPGYIGAKELVANGLDHRAVKIMLDFSADSVSSRFQVDGVWHDSDALERDEGDKVLEAIKILSTMQAEERRARQQGLFQAKYQKKKLICTTLTQGTKTGERVILSFAGDEGKFESLAELGMREQMILRLKELMLSDNGILLFSAMKGGGLTTTLTMALRSTDRLLRDFIALEDVRSKLPEVENVDPVYYDRSKGESPATKLEPILRKQPDVLVVPDLVDKESVGWLCKAAVEDQTVFAAIPAKEAVEALLRVLLMKVPAKDFAPRVVCVLNQRLVRRLCESCKEPYEPPPALLKKLGIPAGRVAELYRHPENPEEVCKECYGIGYLGRTAIFELLVVDDVVREVLIKQPKLDILRKAARKAGSRTLQEEGILAVIQGVTSLPELMRVLKQ